MLKMLKMRLIFYALIGWLDENSSLLRRMSWSIIDSLDHPTKKLRH
jgi:hypothetical protein